MGVAEDTAYHTALLTARENAVTLGAIDVTIGETRVRFHSLADLNAEISRVESKNASPWRLAKCQRPSS